MRKQILDQISIDKILSRIAIEILERNSDSESLAIIGIKKRGDVIAHRIAQKISAMEKIKIDTGAIDITFYRDDVQLKAYKYATKDENQIEISDKNVILVDDVIFTGRSIRAAIDILIDSGRPKSIQLAVLIDRGGREFPIQPDYVGQTIQFHLEEEIIVNFKEVDGVDSVIVTET